MRGAAMSLTAAASGFFVLLLTVPVKLDQNGWAVTYASTKICAVKGSTVEMRCTYTYPSRWKDTDIQVEKTFWFTKALKYKYMDLTGDSDYMGRVHYHCENNNCTLRITDLRERDSAVYKFRVVTNQDNMFGSPGVNLSVTDPQLQVNVKTMTINSFTWTEMTCHSKCQLPDRSFSYIWYKNGQKAENDNVYFLPKSMNPADNYSCAIKDYEMSPSPSVYAPKLPSVAVIPSSQIEEGNLVILSCGSDANPEATYTWYKNPDRHPLRNDSLLIFWGILSSASGEYYCVAENELGRRTSEDISIDVTYAPKLPSVSASPSAEVEEGSSVTLTCSSVANPQANYTWYKDNEDSLITSAQNFTIPEFRAEHSGSYYCAAQNTIGRQNNTVHLTVAADKSRMIMNIIRFTVMVVMLIPLLLLSLWMRTQSRKKKKETLSSTAEPREPVEMELDSCPVYEEVSEEQEDAV